MSARVPLEICSLLITHALQRSLSCLGTVAKTCNKGTVFRLLITRELECGLIVQRIYAVYYPFLGIKGTIAVILSGVDSSINSAAGPAFI